MNSKLSEKEAASFLGISRSTLIRLRNSNQIKCYRIGCRIVYDIEEHLTKFLKQCELKGDEANLVSIS